MSNPVTSGASSRPRVIRVFVSSTFRDMQAEREELVKHVFPQLRKLCEQRGVTWGEVDLRWGVTDEQKAEGKVLPVCLAEIDRCQPYFIGLVGERYGWVPESMPADLRAQRPWLAEVPGGSVTELAVAGVFLYFPRLRLKMEGSLRQINADAGLLQNPAGSPPSVPATGPAPVPGDGEQRPPPAIARGIEQFKLPVDRPESEVMDTQAPESGASRPARTKVMRNDPCPCGSGKKYKNCHMRAL
jgi:hypothetical protein